MAAPGVDIYATVPMSTYAGGNVWSGTSMAAPHVAGAAAVLRQAFPYMTAPQIIEVILTTATDLGDTSIYGHGLLNLERAVKGPIEFGHPSLIPGNESIFAPIFAVDTQGYDSVWSNNISGVGGFSKAGAGMLVLTGASTYTGDTTVTGGVLRVNGSIVESDLTVESGGTLQGTGTVGDTLMRSVLSPGNSVGTLTVDGNLDLAAGSTYLYEIDADQNGDLVVVTGTATIADGAVFELAAEDGVYLDQIYPMLKAGKLTGAFESLQTNYTFIDLDFVSSGGELGMVAERNQVPMAAFAQTNNQRAVANAIDGQSGLVEPYNDVILNDDPTQLPNWYQDWSGEIYSANQAALIYNSRLVAQVVNWRLHDSWLDATQATRLQQVGQSNPKTGDATTVWAQAYGNWDKFSADANAQKATSNSGGFILGVDHKVSPNLRLGGGFSASVTNTSVAASRADTSGYHLLAYGTYQNSHLRLNGGVVQSWYTANVNRTLPLDDLGNASGTLGSNSTQLFTDLSSPITINKGQDHHTNISPFGQVSQIWLNTSNFGENGAEAGLSGQATNASTGFGTLGARLSHEWQSNQTNWQASLSVGWQRAWGDRSPTTTLAFATGPDFTVSSAAIARDSAVIEVGIGASLGPSSRFNLMYSATLANQSNSQMLQAQLQWWF
jgi:subtilase-type serine protease